MYYAQIVSHKIYKEQCCDVLVDNKVSESYVSDAIIPMKINYISIAK